MLIATPIKTSPTASSGVVVGAGLPTAPRFSRPGSGALGPTGLLNLSGFSGGKASAPRSASQKSQPQAGILAPRFSYLEIPLIQKDLNSLS